MLGTRNLVDGKKLAKLIQQQLKCHCASLNGIFQHRETLTAFAYAMYQVGIITDQIRDNPIYNDIEKQFILSLELLSKKEKFEKLCKDYIQELANIGGSIGGSLRDIAETLKNEWTEKAQEELGITLSLD